MTAFERLCVALRHSRILRNQAGLWNLVRPAYDLFWRLAPKSWSDRFVNGADIVAVQSRWRDGLETYEADVWPHVMNEIRQGDTFVDVGAFIGLYAIAVAKRVQPGGRVVAFEPDPGNFAVLGQHIRLNKVDDYVVAIQAAVSSSDGEMYFKSGGGSQSRLVVAGSSEATRAVRVAVRSLDSWCTDCGVDVLKIDVEGFEHAVLSGATRLLGDLKLRPRSIFIEVHPYAWEQSGGSSNAILSLLRAARYKVTYPDGSAVSELTEYGEIVARLQS